MTKGRLDADIFPHLGRKAVRSILPRHVLEALRLVEKRGSTGIAHRLRGTCSEIFRYGIPDGRVDSDPCRDLILAMVKIPATRHMAKVEAKDLPAFFSQAQRRSGRAHEPPGVTLDPAHHGSDPREALCDLVGIRGLGNG